MADKIKVTFSQIRVTNNGEWTGKGELYWDLLVDGQPLGGDGSRSLSNPRKTADGETIVLNGVSRTVTKASGQRLVVQGNVSEKDNTDRDETDGFEDVYDTTNNWGIGAYTRTLRDGNMDVAVSYQISRV
jgi:hypothetical protein